MTRKVSSNSNEAATRVFVMEIEFKSTNWPPCQSTRRLSYEYSLIVEFSGPKVIERCHNKSMRSTIYHGARLMMARVG